MNNTGSVFFRWLVLVIAVWVATLVPGIDFTSWQGLVITALVLSILNTFVKPVLMLLSAPLIIATLGVFLLLINALIFKMAAWLVPDFHVASFWSALGGSLVISIVSMFFGWRRRDSERCVTYIYRGDERRGPPPGDGPVINV